MAYVVLTKVKDYVKSHDLNTSSSVTEALDAKVELFLSDACKRAKANGRKTLHEKDL